MLLAYPVGREDSGRTVDSFQEKALSPLDLGRGAAHEDGREKFGGCSLPFEINAE